VPHIAGASRLLSPVLLVRSALVVVSRHALLHRAAVAYHTCFFCPATATTEISPLSLHDALPIFLRRKPGRYNATVTGERWHCSRSEEHTSELQSRFDLVCRPLLEKKKHSAGAGGADGRGERSAAEPYAVNRPQLKHLRDDGDELA